MKGGLSAVAAALALGMAGLAYAQLNFPQVQVLGRPVQAVVLSGVEYVRDSVLAGPLHISRAGEVVRVEGFGRLLLLPIDQDQGRAAGGTDTVQLGAARQAGHTATLINNHLYLPLDTLALGLGAQYTPGSFSLPASRLLGVSSRAGKDIDRAVLELNRDVRFRAQLTGSELDIVLPGTEAADEAYSTRGRYLPRLQVRRRGADTVISVPLGENDGYRLYRTGASDRARLVLDVGPGIARTTPALKERAQRPLIVLDPAQPGAGGRLGDVSLEVARETGELLTKAGWQVRLTRSGPGEVPLRDRAGLARESDVFVSFDIGRLPGNAARGVTLYEGASQSGAALIDNVRESGRPDALLALAVGDDGQNRRLAQVMRGELDALDVPARSASLERAYLLREAPQAALLVELGWAQNDADAARLTDAPRLASLSRALARSVATYLVARMNGKRS